MIYTFIVDKSHYIGKFTIVGFVGFIIDATILTLLSVNIGMNIFFSRTVSFITATLVTWILNRIYTFRKHTKKSDINTREYRRYLLIQTGGAIVNLIVFTIIILLVPKLIGTPIIPLAIGAIFGLAFNFIGSLYWVYRI